jgi:ABC-2 type transport system ATP-binding protein
MAAIEAERVTKVYRTRWGRRGFRALDEVSFSVQEGSAFGLLGPNGAGKTTFVKSLLSATWATSGTTRIFGQDSRTAEARRPVGYLPENHRFPTYLTGAGMLDLYGALSGVGAGERRRRIPELLGLVGLEDWGGVRLGKYSKGMLQRVGLAQSLLHRPRLLVLDEPSDGVDPVGRAHIRGIIQKLVSDGVTVFLNSHLLAEVEAICSDVVILHKGKVRLGGRVGELTANRGYRLTTPAPGEPLAGKLGLMASSWESRNGHTDFQFASRDVANEAIDVLRGAGHPVEALAQTRGTLEELFLETVRD